MENTHLEKYRRESIILGNRNTSSLNQPVIEGNPSNLRSHLMQIRGNENGIYFDSHHKEVPSKLTRLREQEKELAQRWEKHCLDQLMVGNQRPKQMPPEMAEEKLKLEARIMVVNEEIKWLEMKLVDALEQQKKKARPSLLTHPRNWGSGQLRNGQLQSIGPFSVSPNEEGLLVIDDESSPYHTMPVWEFKSLIAKPMSMEFVHRHKMEEREAVAEGRPKKAVKYPEPPSWNPETDVIEYHGICNDVIKKLKREN